MLMGTAISATACHQEEEYPSVPEVTEPQPTGEIIPTVDRQKELKDARKKYSDAVVWLYMPDAEVDDPVVQAKDNAYYLQKDENENYSEWGCYYAHCDNRLSSRSKLDRNTVIFGHSASNCDPDGPKLTKLHRYMDADYVKENPYVYLSVKGEDMVFQITACFITDIDFDYIAPNSTGEELTNFFEQVAKKNWLEFDGVTFTVTVYVDKGTLADQFWDMRGSSSGSCPVNCSGSRNSSVYRATCSSVREQRPPSRSSPTRKNGPQMMSSSSRRLGAMPLSFPSSLQQSSTPSSIYTGWNSPCTSCWMASSPSAISFT